LKKLVVDENALLKLLRILAIRIATRAICRMTSEVAQRYSQRALKQSR
jgi:hypothetical protein